MRAVAALAPAPYTHVGLNFYRDGRDGVAMHGDRTAHLADAMPIAILSLGATRDMLVRGQSDGGREVDPGETVAPGGVVVGTQIHRNGHR